MLMQKLQGQRKGASERLSKAHYIDDR